MLSLSLATTPALIPAMLMSRDQGDQPASVVAPRMRHRVGNKNPVDRVREKPAAGARPGPVRPRRRFPRDSSVARTRDARGQMARR